MSNKSRSTRDRLIEALRRELMGPSAPDETITGEFPTSRYVVGRLAPARSADDDTDAAIDPIENDTLEVGVGDDETGENNPSPPLIIGFNPSSCGLSFLLDGKVNALRAKVSWGDYRRERTDHDPPPLNWSDSKYGFLPEEDCNAEEETQAGRDRRQAASG